MNTKAEVLIEMKKREFYLLEVIDVEEISDSPERALSINKMRNNTLKLIGELSIAIRESNDINSKEFEELHTEKVNMIDLFDLDYSNQVIDIEQFKDWLEN